MSPGCALATVAVAAMAFPSLLTWLYFVVLQGHSTAVQQAVYTAGKVLQFGLPLLWLMAVRRAVYPAGQFAEDLGLTVFDRGGSGLRVAGRDRNLGRLSGVAALGRLGLRPLKPRYAEGAGFRPAYSSEFAAVGIFYGLSTRGWKNTIGGGSFSANCGGCCRWADNSLASLAFAAHHWIVLGVYFGGFRRSAA